MSRFSITNLPADDLCLSRQDYFLQASACFMRRPYDKDGNQTDINLIENWWDGMIQKYGQRVDYYVNTFTIAEDDKFYGQQPTRRFHPPVEMIMGVQYNTVALSMGKFGFVNDSEITAHILFTRFVEAFDGDTIHATVGDVIEPKAGDVFHLRVFGKDRPSRREGYWFEITSRTDENIETINQLGGHFIWEIKAKKLDYSFEPGLMVKYVEDTVEDNGNYGVTSRVNSADNTPPKLYEYDSDVEAVEKIIKQSDVGDVFGGY